MPKDIFNIECAIDGNVNNMEVLKVWTLTEEIDYFAVNKGSEVLRLSKNSDGKWVNIEGVNNSEIDVIGKAILEKVEF